MQCNRNLRGSPISLLCVLARDVLGNCVFSSLQLIVRTAILQHGQTWNSNNCWVLMRITSAMNIANWRARQTAHVLCTESVTPPSECLLPSDCSLAAYSWLSWVVCMKNSYHRTAEQDQGSSSTNLCTSAKKLIKTGFEIIRCCCWRRKNIFGVMLTRKHMHWTEWPFRQCKELLISTFVLIKLWCNFFNPRLTGKFNTV